MSSKSFLSSPGVSSERSRTDGTRRKINTSNPTEVSLRLHAEEEIPMLNPTETSLRLHAEKEIPIEMYSVGAREWMTTEQAAKYLGLSAGALRNMTSNGQVPYHKLGRRNRYHVVELRRLLLSQRGGCSGNKK